jgi:replicative DNA helicase
MKWGGSLLDNVNINVERALLSSVVYDNEKIIDLIKSSVVAEHFYLPFHATLYTTMLNLYNQQKNFDEIIIPAEMGEAFQEGPMLEILNANPLSNMNQYIHLFKDDFAKRSAQEKIATLYKSSREEVNVDLIVSQMQESINELSTHSDDSFFIEPMAKVEEKQTEYYCKDYLPIPMNSVTILSARGGMGKSFTCMNIMSRILHQHKELKCYAWLSEDDPGASRTRFNYINEKVLRKPSSEIINRIDISGSTSMPFHFIERDRNNIKIGVKFERFKRALAAYDFIVLDPLIAFFGSDENDNAHARYFMNLLTSWATSENKTILIVHHGSKKGSESRGASAFVDAARLAYEMNIITEKKGEDSVQIEAHNREFVMSKDNTGAKKFFNNQTKVKRQIFHIPEVEIEFIKR